MPNVILTVMNVHCMYTCMLVHVYLGGLSNDDHHSEPRQNFFKNFFREEGGSLGHSICIYHNQAVQDNVYLMSCKEEGS